MNETNNEHYMAKLNRNVNVLDKVPEEYRDTFRSNIEWARELIGRLDNLDYNEREVAIQRIHAVLDHDYNSLGFNLENNSDFNIKGNKSIKKDEKNSRHTVSTAYGSGLYFTRSTCEVPSELNCVWLKDFKNFVCAIFSMDIEINWLRKVK